MARLSLMDAQIVAGALSMEVGRTYKVSRVPIHLTDGVRKYALHLMQKDNKHVPERAVLLDGSLGEIVAALTGLRFAATEYLKVK